MLSVIVLFALLMLGASGFYLLLGKLGMFNKVGDAVLEIQKDVQEQIETEEKPSEKKKGRDV